ncbi:hypothetical protein NJC10_00240 [Micrococcus sp. M4NT]|uniref:hypothetical protein n=1 Tax=Micrococcus sp. M4NT TaxID=2957501 RepID=UPI0029A149A2|nr:hypothetical protein [Micrococcus sp. M4NT]MDX2340110.1 hypothetical protein [Micrococcus sp. M4NT]
MTGPRWITEAEYATALTLYRGRPELWTAEGLAELLDLFGALGAPRTLNALANTPGFPLDLVRPHVAYAHAASYRPEYTLDRGSWIDLFRRIGFTFNGEPATLPTEPRTLWRGTRPGYSDNLSWTPERAIAVTFAARPGAVLYRTEVPPGRVLAVLADDRYEPQWLASVAGLDKVKEELSAEDWAFAREWEAESAAVRAGMPALERAQLAAAERMFRAWEK